MELFKLTKLDYIPDFFKKEIEVPKFEGGFYQKNYEGELTDEFKENFKRYFSILIGYQIDISIGWINFTKYNGVENNFNWHNENGVNGHVFSDYENSCVFWLAGEKEKGGGFRYIDLNDNINIVELDPPSFMIIKRDTLHSVESYYGQENRVSFNFNFERK
jgi:hypothetical protein